MPRCRILVLLACCLALSAATAADTRYLDYLTKTGLQAAECAEHSPGELFHLIRERAKVTFGGTPGQDAEVVDAFYKRYLEVMKPHNDRHHAEASKARLALRELLGFITDAFEDATRDRTCITPERVDAYVEHLITRLSQQGLPSRARDLDLSADDAGAYLRARLILVRSAAIEEPDYDLFRGQVTRMLRNLSREFSIEPLLLHYHIVKFADNYRTPLNPLIGAPDDETTL